MGPDVHTGTHTSLGRLAWQAPSRTTAPPPVSPPSARTPARPARQPAPTALAGEALLASFAHGTRKQYGRRHHPRLTPPPPPSLSLGPLRRGSDRSLGSCDSLKPLESREDFDSGTAGSFQSKRHQE